jgi:hypothetical protein
MFDLRLLGRSATLSARAMAHHLLPWARAALIMVVPSGVLMFAAHATEFVDNPAFRLKLALLAGAGLNAWLFHRKTFASVADWDRERPAPPGARAAAVVSLLLWAGVLAAGRLIAYL